MNLPVGIATQRLAQAFTILAVMWAGALFGFFFAWMTSAMPGLDAIDANTAIAAMQSMNAGVRNPVFGSVFFGAPVVIGVAAVTSLKAGTHKAAGLQALAWGLFMVGVMVLTLTANVPLNEALAQHTLPMDASSARTLWVEYSGPWQAYNLIRMGVAGTVLFLLVMALWKTPRCHNA